MKKNPVTGTNNPKSARYMFNFEAQNPPVIRQNNGRIPGGSKMGMVPSPQQVEMNAGAKKKRGPKSIKGGAIVLNRGEQVDTNDSVKPMEGAGLFSTIGDIADGVGGLFGLGKQKVAGKRGRKPMTNVLTLAEQAKRLKAHMKGGIEIGQNTEAPLGITDDNKKLMASGLFGDIGSVIDSGASLLGIGKGSKKSMKAGAVDELNQQLDSLEGGIKRIKTLINKL